MTEETKAPEQIIINGREYTSEDASQLIELGNKWKETESKLNTSLDKVFPEYTRTTQELKEKERLLAERDAELEKFKAQQIEAEKEQTPDEIKKARQAARDLGLADEDFLKEKGYVTRDEVKEYITQTQRNQEAGKQLLDQCAQYEKQIDGSDGRVPFDTEAVLFYANGKGIFDVMEAYKEMNKKGNARWEAEQLAKEERPSLTTLQGGGKKEPQRPKYTNDNIGQALGEWLDGIPE